MIGFTRGETYTVPHRMPDAVPLIALKAGVIGDIRHAEEDVPLIHGEWLTDAGIHYLDSILDDPECERTNQPQDLYRKSWRAGLVPMPTPAVQDLTSASFEDYDRVMSIARKMSRAEELRQKRADLEAELAEAEREERELRRQFSEPGPESTIMIEATFPGSQGTGGSKVYKYLAMRTDNPRDGYATWYVTGQKGKLAWSQIIDLVKHARHVELFDLDFSRS